MKHKPHRHHHGSVGAQLARLALGIAVTVVQRKIANRLSQPPRREHRSRGHSGRDRGPGDPPAPGCVTA